MKLSVDPLTIKTRASHEVPLGSVVVRGAAVGLIIGPADTGSAEKYLLFSEDGIVLTPLEEAPQRTIVIAAPGAVRLILGTAAAPRAGHPASTVGLLGVDRNGCFMVADKRVASGRPDQSNPAVIAFDDWREHGPARLEQATCWFKEWALVVHDQRGNAATLIEA